MEALYNYRTIELASLEKARQISMKPFYYTVLSYILIG